MHGEWRESRSQRRLKQIIPQQRPQDRLAVAAQYLYISTYILLEPPLPRVRPTQDIRPLADFRANLAAVVRQVQRTKRPIILTQHGRSAAVLVDAGECEALVDRAELLEDVRVAEAEIAAGKGVSQSRAKAAVLGALRR